MFLIQQSTSEFRRSSLPCSSYHSFAFVREARQAERTQSSGRMVPSNRSAVPSMYENDGLCPHYRNNRHA